jgi:methionyl-tRNA formyltransferase
MSASGSLGVAARGESRDRDVRDRPIVRVVAVTQDDPFFTGRFFETFLESLPPNVELVEIVLLRNFNESRLALVRRFARLYGPLGVLRLIARYVRASVDERRGVARTVAAVAARYGVPVRAAETINDPQYLSTLTARRIDVLLSVAAPEIFRPEALRAAPHVLNVHNGRLPQYRGMMPTFWALLDGGREVVVTVHEMDEHLDTGAVLAEFPVPVDDGESAFEVSRTAKAAAGRSVAGLLGELGTEAWPQPRAIDASAGRYWHFPQRGDARRLKRQGRSML